MFRRKLFAIAALFLSFIALHAQNGDGILAVDATKNVSSVSPMLYGLMTEEINHSFDGGLYAEMVQNRTFRHTWDGYEHWTPVLHGDSELDVLDGKDGPSAALSTSLVLKVTKASMDAEAGLANDGYWGMGLAPNTVYKGSFYAKPTGVEEARIALVENATGATVGETHVSMPDGGWQRFTYTLTTASSLKTGDGYHLEITFHRPGSIAIQLFSLFPPTYHDRPNGNRRDLMGMLAAMHPHFLRFPGGNYLEGDTIKERFKWKETIGPLVDRPTHRGPWGYQSTDGMGLLEFLEWCEDLNIQPVLAIYGGYSLKGETILGKDLEPFIQEDLDEIEYVTGAPSSRWGAMRARDGHPEPFPLHYIEIGNEDDMGPRKTYEERFSAISSAIRAKYGDRFKLIATTPVKQSHSDLVDDHYYRSPEGFFAIDKKYDAAERNGQKIFVGEWATRTGSPTSDFGAALGDAAWMTSLERNSDLIEMASYAPLFTNVNPGGMQWASDLIGYNASTAYGSPSYWAQVLFGQHLGDHTVYTAGSGLNPRFFWSATVSSATRVLHLKIVNASDKPQSLSLAFSGTKAGPVTIWSLHADSRFATNTIQQPEAIVPHERHERVAGKTWRHDLQANTIEVLDVPLL